MNVQCKARKISSALSQRKLRISLNLRLSSSSSNLAIVQSPPNSSYFSTSTVLYTKLEDKTADISSTSHPSSGSSSSQRGHFPTHEDTIIHTNCTQKALLAVGSATMGLIDPHRADHIATLGEITGTWALQQMLDRMKKDIVGRQILEEKPRINSRSIPIDYLASLPEESFGGVYHNWMSVRGFQADERPHVKFVENAELAYVITRYREVHDFLHSLFDLPSDVYSEICLKMFELYQTGMPSCMLSVLFGPLRLSIPEQLRLVTHGYPWAVDAARKAPFFLNIYYEKHLERPVDEVRKELGFDTNNP